MENLKDTLMNFIFTINDECEKNKIYNSITLHELAFVRIVMFPRVGSKHNDRTNFSIDIPLNENSLTENLPILVNLITDWV